MTDWDENVKDIYNNNNIIFVFVEQEGGDGRQCLENKERLTLRIHRGRSGQRPPALTSVLLAKHGCPPGLGPALAGLASRNLVNHLTEVNNSASVVASSNSSDQQPTSMSVASVSGGATSSIESDCDLCRDNQRLVHQQQQQQYQQQQQFQQQQQIHQSSSGLRENVSNASQAYKVLYMETPLCSCGRMNANGNRAGKSGNKRSALEIFQASGHKKNKSSHGKYSGHRCFGTRTATAGGAGPEDGGDPSGSANSHAKPVHKLNRRNIKAQVKRFKMETKAAKTLGKNDSSGI